MSIFRVGHLLTSVDRKSDTDGTIKSFKRLLRYIYQYYEIMIEKKNKHIRKMQKKKNWQAKDKINDFLYPSHGTQIIIPYRIFACVKWAKRYISPDIYICVFGGFLKKINNIPIILQYVWLQNIYYFIGSILNILEKKKHFKIHNNKWFDFKYVGYR